jgi:hypothetical protein
MPVLTTIALPIYARHNDRSTFRSSLCLVPIVSHSQVSFPSAVGTGNTESSNVRMSGVPVRQAEPFERCVLRQTHQDMRSRVPHIRGSGAVDPLIA